MKYELISIKQEAVKISDDKKTINVDYTITGKATDGEIELPINTGTTIENVPLSLGEEIPPYLEKKATEWFLNKYK